MPVIILDPNALTDQVFFGLLFALPKPSSVPAVI